VSEGPRRQLNARFSRSTHWILLALLLGNVLAFIGVVAFRPSAGWDWPGDAPDHVQQTIRTAWLSAGAVVLAVVIPWLRERSRVWWLGLLAFELIQVTRLVPAGRALDHWPGGDDGPGLAWGMMLLPLLLLLALVGGILVLRDGIRQVRAGKW
jgi:hypothetical protein